MSRRSNSNEIALGHPVVSGKTISKVDRCSLNLLNCLTLNVHPVIFGVVSLSARFINVRLTRSSQMAIPTVLWAECWRRLGRRLREGLYRMNTEKTWRRLFILLPDLYAGGVDCLPVLARLDNALVETRMNINFVTNPVICWSIGGHKIELPVASSHFELWILLGAWVIVFNLRCSSAWHRDNIHFSLNQEVLRSIFLPFLILNLCQVQFHWSYEHAPSSEQKQISTGCRID